MRMRSLESSRRFSSSMYMLRTCSESSSPSTSAKHSWTAPQVMNRTSGSSSSMQLFSTGSRGPGSKPLPSCVITASLSQRRALRSCRRHATPPFRSAPATFPARHMHTGTTTSESNSAPRARAGSLSASSDSTWSSSTRSVDRTCASRCASAASANTGMHVPKCGASAAEPSRSRVSKRRSSCESRRHSFALAATASRTGPASEA
mmetsp:Transcript_31597/g.75080  ORF Transcript_31597/g.75080 Transcript_31597/m.75080 type:complete len:205 (-) Transcript_31597:689-1303(-)